MQRMPVDVRVDPTKGLVNLSALFEGTTVRRLASPHVLDEGLQVKVDAHLDS